MSPAGSAPGRVGNTNLCHDDTDASRPMWSDRHREGRQYGQAGARFAAVPGLDPDTRAAGLLPARSAGGATPPGAAPS